MNQVIAAAIAFSFLATPAAFAAQRCPPLETGTEGKGPEARGNQEGRPEAQR
ncbi:hypothetical protein HED55_17105 [Ochrobactrum haematophilum]|uniref:Uncharacterized protein n=1 Tax=Brucella haematophila TaxID=419474 RepID=A0ABX1DN03_9HYPH|nr:hypothetical protein [Brucella haematophila]